PDFFIFTFNFLPLTFNSQVIDKGLQTRDCFNRHMPVAGLLPGSLRLSNCPAERKSCLIVLEQGVTV
ncbi:MAG: hypothetical protein ACOCV7_07745, partial [Desulfonatronovibrionaceae bacterium]